MRVHSITFRFDEAKGGFSCEVSCRGDEQTVLHEVPASAAPKAQAQKAQVQKPTDDLDEAQRALFETLRAWRSKTAHDEGVPPYVVLTNRQLLEIVRRKPANPTALARIDGLGPKKVERHGKALLAVLHPVSDENVPNETAIDENVADETVARENRAEAAS